MNDEFGFAYKNLAGAKEESSLTDLRRVAEGPVDLGDGWIGDRVNFDKKKGCLIEFRTGQERAPGHADSCACEVTIDYVTRRYNVSRQQVEASMSLG